MPTDYETNRPPTNCEQLFAWLVGVYDLDIDVQKEPTQMELNQVRQVVLCHKRDADAYRTLARSLTEAVDNERLCSGGV